MVYFRKREAVGEEGISQAGGVENGKNDFSGDRDALRGLCGECGAKCEKTLRGVGGLCQHWLQNDGTAAGSFRGDDGGDSGGGPEGGLRGGSSDAGEQGQGGGRRGGDRLLFPTVSDGAGVRSPSLLCGHAPDGGSALVFDDRAGRCMDTDPSSDSGPDCGTAVLQLGIADASASCAEHGFADCALHGGRGGVQSLPDGPGGVWTSVL